MFISPTPQKETFREDILGKSFGKSEPKETELTDIHLVGGTFPPLVTDFLERD